MNTKLFFSIVCIAIASVVLIAPSAHAQISKEQLIINVLPDFVNVFGNNPTEKEKTWWRDRISCGEITTEEKLLSSMQYTKEHKTRIGSPYICGKSATSIAKKTTNSSTKTSTSITKATIDGIDGNKDGDLVRIGITYTDGKAITVTANNSFQVREGGDKILATLKAGQNIAVSFSGGQYHVRGSGKKFDTVNKIRFVGLNGAIMQIVSYNDPSVTYPGKNYNRFRGTIEIRKCDNCNQLWAINEIRTELYLRGLGETSGEGPEQYVEALGIAARTYVLYHKIVTGGRSIHNDFDITNTPNDQIYRGYEYEIITPRMSNLFNKVRGVIIVNKEQTQPIASIYFSDSDGRTHTAKEEWGTDRFPYLQRSVKDPYHVTAKCNGHCVGMSAQGAYGFAKAQDWSFQKILTYYFYGVKIVKAY